MAEQFESNSMGSLGASKTMQEIQSDRGIVREYGPFNADANPVACPESRTSIVISNLMPNEGAGEIDEQTTNIQALQSDADQPTRRRPAGPGSRIAKRRSSHNAIKSGIFAKTTLLKGESPEEYELLRERFWKAKLPEDEYQELLLDMIVSNAWRQLRVLAVENAEIQIKSEFMEFDRRRSEQAEAERINESKQPGAVDVFTVEPVTLISNIHNPIILQRCIKLLVDLRQRIEIYGFVEDWDRLLLKRIYGEPSVLKDGYVVNDKYSAWLKTAKVPEEERRRKGYSTPEECKQIAIREIGAEIARLKQYQRRSESIESKRRQLEILVQRVPDSPVLDRLLRSRNSLEREFYRLLAEYERAQRIRRGQPLPPQVDVKIS